MNLIDWVKGLFSGSKPTEAPELHCPNCWGRQEYEGKFLDAIKKEDIDLNNLNEKKGWIQEYAVKNFEGIKLRKTQDYFECPTCKLDYKNTGK